jgi:hypothetical protein
MILPDFLFGGVGGGKMRKELLGYGLNRKELK